MVEQINPKKHQEPTREGTNPAQSPNTDLRVGKGLSETEVIKAKG